jgi:NADPH:quinone reductase-like Zn-dependent oxidoreductase/acyl carrier protein/NAD(P)-dependent dehydrogenase (short-subunit alcohol dehydrogenase family)
VFDSHVPYYTYASIIARPVATTPGSITRLTLLTSGQEPSDFATITKRKLEEAGYQIDGCTWGSELPSDQDVISLIDIDSTSPILSDENPETLAAFLDYIGDAATSTFLWLTKPSQTTCSDPRHGLVLGIGRTIRAELDMNFATLELDKLDDDAASAVVNVLRKLQNAVRYEETQGNDTKTSDIKADCEYAFSNGELLLPRLHPFGLSQALTEEMAHVESKRLVIGQRGILSTLHWVGDTFAPLGPDEVEVKVTAAGLNFLDLAVAMNIVDMAQSLGRGYNALGSEGAGVITKVGSNVSDFKPGDRVATMAADTGVFASKLRRPASACVHLPPDLSDEDAAGLLIPYVTVMWSFVEKARLRKGQTVLIHSAAGGVGIAAIHVARWLGAEIYATVGTTAKVEFLVNELGIPRNRIFNSRDDSFARDILAATGGKGMDAVLNSLSGELLHATWRCVAPGGCMLEIGKRDFLGRAQLAMYLFEENRAYFGIDLSRLSLSEPEAMRTFSIQTMELLGTGQFQPLRPTTIFDGEKVEDAFRYMQRGVHMGRIVVRMPDDDSILHIAPTMPAPYFRPNATYLLAGGMGGLGRSIIRWMASHGAKCLTVVSRSAGLGPQDQALIAEIGELGCLLQCFAADISDANSMQTVISSICQPIAGVLQMAMVLRDVGIPNLDFEAWTEALRPKMQGTWNLHNLLPKDLDFFVCFGSISGTLASYGQGNYAAGNSFLDSFVRYRHGMGQAASVIDIAAIGDVGYVAETKDVAERIGRAFGRLGTEQEFLDALQLTIKRSKEKREFIPREPTKFSQLSQIVMHNNMNPRLSDPRNTSPWRRDARIAIYRNSEEASQSTSSQGSKRLGLFLVSLTTEPEKLDEPETPALFAQEIAKRVAAFLMREEEENAVLNTSQTLADMGADSLVAIEIRNWWKQTFGIEISILELNSPAQTLESLGRLATERLKELYMLKAANASS